MKLPLLHAFGAITRRDDENRIVEGYCFVNESVKSDKYNLKRSAMEAATEDYLNWGAVREMHGSNAAGTANDGQDSTLGVTWDDRGAMFRCKVVDDNAWQKVVEGVYKGFSVGVRPLVLRGKDVVKADWTEVSLVDRPADPDARCAIARSDNFDESATEFEVEVEEMVSRAEDLETIQRLEGERADFIARLEASESAAAENLTRAENAEAEIQRLQTAQTDMITRLAGAMAPGDDEEAEATIERAINLLSKPDPAQQKPMKITAKHLVERLQSGPSEEEAEAIEKAKVEYSEIMRSDWSAKTDSEKQSALLRVEELKRVLQ